MLSYDRIKSAIGDGHPNGKFTNDLGALHKYEILYTLDIKIHLKYKRCK